MSLSIGGEEVQEVEVARQVRVNSAAFPGTVGNKLTFPWGGVELMRFILTSMRVKGSQRKTELKKNEDRFLRTFFGTWIQLCLKATFVDGTVH